MENRILIKARASRAGDSPAARSMGRLHAQATSNSPGNQQHSLERLIGEGVPLGNQRTAGTGTAELMRSEGSRSGKDAGAAPRVDARAIGLGHATRLALFYGASFTVYGISMPYLNVWLKHRGLTIGEIATVSAIGPVVRMVCGPITTFSADRWNAHARLLAVASWGALAAWFVMSWASGLWSALIGMALIAMTSAALNPLIDTIAMMAVRTQAIDYGRVRAWGSITFIIAAVASGFAVDWRGPDVAIDLLVIAAAATAISTVFLPGSAPADPSVQRKPLSIADALALVRHPTLVLFLVSAGTVQGSHAVLNVFSVLHWQSLGLSNWWCGVLWAIAVIAEILLFLAAGRWLPRVGAISLLTLGGAAAVIRWTVMAFDPPLGVLVPLQVAHGLTFGASHLGAMSFLARAVPEEQAGTAQGLYSLMTGGLVMAISTQVAGIAYSSVGGRAYGAMTVIAAISLAATFLLYRAWGGERLSIQPRGAARDREA